VGCGRLVGFAPNSPQIHFLLLGATRQASVRHISLRASSAACTLILLHPSLLPPETKSSTQNILRVRSVPRSRISINLARNRLYSWLSWELRVTAVHPDQGRLPDARNPASLNPMDVRNSADQFAALINRLQRHSQCTTAYGLRSKKGSMEPPTCRFFFPKPLFDEAVSTDKTNHRSQLFSPAWNHPTLNQCSPVITMGWLANTDFQSPLTMHAVLSYLGKYVSKPEKSSVSYAKLQAHVLPYVNDRAPLLSFVSRILNKLIGERDWSAQEISHILLRLPVQESSRQVVSLDCRPKEEQSQLVVLESGEVSAQRSVLQRYCGRLTESALSTLPSLTLFECLQSWDWIKWKRRPV
jgi:hypothetical protein